MNSEMRVSFPDAPFLILPVLSMLVSVAVMVLAVLALWRIMKAQEATADALQQIADTFRSRSP